MITKFSNEIRPIITTRQAETRREKKYTPQIAPKIQKDSVSFGAAKFKPGVIVAYESKYLKKLIDTTKSAVGDNEKKITKFLSQAFEEAFDGKPGRIIKKLEDKDKDILNKLQSTLDETVNILKEDKTKCIGGNFKYGISKEKLMAVLKSAIEDRHIMDKQKTLYNNETLHKLLNLANANQGVFNAGFALILAGLLRPITILAMPAKNKDDNAYAAGHSISSGVIGFLASMLINNPLANALANVKNNPDKYIKDKKILKNLGDVVDEEIKDSKGKVIGVRKTITGKNIDLVRRYVNLLADTVFAIPKAAFTIAFIPFLLKSVFGLEKGKNKNNKLAVEQNQPQNNNIQIKSSKDLKPVFAGNKNKVSFGSIHGAKELGPIQKFLTEKMAKLMNSDLMQRVLKKTNQLDFDVVKHLNAINGLIVGGVYVGRTLKNDKLDPERRSTLAINQGMVSVLSTILGYIVNGAVDKKIDKVIEKFQAANIHKGVDKLGEFAGGFRAATSMIIFGLIYRYISPVLITPIANKIGEYLAERKAKKAQEKQLAMA